MTKLCATCKADKPLSEYYKVSGNRDGLNYSCKPCIQSYRRSWLENNPDYFYTWNIENRYGLSKAEYTHMLSNQEYKCAICACTSSPDKRSARLWVDHCHRTGHVRGLLCSDCNRLLGAAKDDVEILEKAKLYLRASK